MSNTQCQCDRPLFNDERAINMGVNCVICGRSAEHRLPEDVLRAIMREEKKRRFDARRRRNAEESQQR